MTATVHNASDIAAWMNCSLVESSSRDIELLQEIWFKGHCYRVKFGQDEGELIGGPGGSPSHLDEVIDHLLRREITPILVFTESRREASDLAASYSKRCQRSSSGIDMAQQLELFSEPTERSGSLQETAERRVAFHTADLTPQERQVVEQGFLNNRFDVCFATSTLAAGVNFPFKAVVFPKLTYEYGDREGVRISRSEFRNMSGRAGRLGMHDVGYAVLLPRNDVENSHANQIVLPANDIVHSKLARLTMRRGVLKLVAARVVNSDETLRDFFHNTYFWHLILDTNPSRLEEVLLKAQHALQWLVESKFVDQFDDTYLITPLGKATAASGLLPATAVAFLDLVDKCREDLKHDFEGLVNSLIHWVVCGDEFLGDPPSRMLPYPRDRRMFGSLEFLARKNLLLSLDRSDSRLCKSLHALILFVDGSSEGQIFHQTGMSSGGVHRLAMDVSWVLDGLRRIAAAPELKCPQQIGNQFELLAQRVRWGCPTEALDLVRIAQRGRVPGFGRQRAMKLIGEGVDTIERILDLGLADLQRILGSEARASALVATIQEQMEVGPGRLERSHFNVAENLNIKEVVQSCYELWETDYEDAIFDLLGSNHSWTVTLLDDGKRRNVPDLLFGGTGAGAGVLLEIKTAPRRSGRIKKEEAFAVLQKGADFDPRMSRVTLGKLEFDTMSNQKAAGSSQITLVKHSTFLEAVLRVMAGQIQVDEFFAWLTEPGIAEFERIPGKPTYQLL